jgi:hypothetical protein
MGRPPIGKQAMSGAERTRQYRERLRRSEPVTKPSGPARGDDSEEMMTKKRKQYREAYGKRIGEALYVTHMGVRDAHRHGDAADQAEAHAIHDLIKTNFPKLPKQKPPKPAKQKTPESNT